MLPPRVDLVVPVLNEAHVLPRSIETIRAFLSEKFPYRWQVTIVDNGSTDGTYEVAQGLANQHDDVRCFRLDQRGKGRAVRFAWSRSDADIMAYTDVDLSAELQCLEMLCRSIHEEGFDIAAGSRLMTESKIRRGFKRELISRCYNLFVKGVLWTHFSDAQCGFKAVSRRVTEIIMPQVKDQAWFFDTELMTIAEKQGYRIKDVPLRWVDDRDSRVRIIPTTWAVVKGVLRVRLALWLGHYAHGPARNAQPAEASMQA